MAISQELWSDICQEELAQEATAGQQEKKRSIWRCARREQKKKNAAPPRESTSSHSWDTTIAPPQLDKKDLIRRAEAQMLAWGAAIDSLINEEARDPFALGRLRDAVNASGILFRDLQMEEAMRSSYPPTVAWSFGAAMRDADLDCL